MKSCFSIFIFIIYLFFAFESSGQISNYIFALNNSSSGAFYFCKIEISTGIITNFQLVTTIMSSAYSSCIDNLNQKYYLCLGNTLITCDPNTGNQVSNVILPIPSTASFIHIKYNPCDSNIYGIVNNYPTNILFEKYNPATGTMTYISTLNPNMFFCMGCMSILDPDSNIFAFDNGNLIGLDLTSGQIRYNSPKINLPNENFGHIALKCNTHEIFGTSANVNAGVKYLSVINPYTGLVSHVSNAGWNVGIWKPASGGDCINQITGDYYYSGMGSLIVGANTLTGNMISNQTINSGELYFIDHFSDCKCGSVIKNDIINVSQEIEFITNPFNDKLIIHSNTSEEYEIILYDITSRKVLQEKFSSFVTINTEQLNNGIYLYEIKDKRAVVKNGKLVKE